MSVFTELNPREVQTLLADYALGDLLHCAGVPGGTDNTNYFLETTRGKYVLTVLERTDDAASEFAGALAQHLLRHKIPSAPPVQRSDGAVFTRYNGKRVVLAPRLAGSSILEPGAVECGQVGEMLARMHVTAKSFVLERPNPYGYEWLKRTRQSLSAVLSSTQQTLFDTQLRELAQIDRAPAGQIIHGDLFRDNVLFSAGHISGVIDLYFACNDHWLLDLAITANDWCWRDDALDESKLSALCSAYSKLRPFIDFEYQHWPLFLRYAALRFWASRLLDQHLPRAGHYVVSKPASQMEDLLRYHRQQSPPPLP